MKENTGSMKGVKVVMFLLFVLVCTLPAFAQNITKVRSDGLTTNYLSTEDLVYYSCPETQGADFRNSLFCLDDSTLVNLDAVTWDNGCTLSTYDLENINCQNLLLQSEYIQNNDNVKVTDRIRIRRVNSVLDQIARGQDSDGSWGDPISTAYAIYAYSAFPNAFEDQINDGLAWLKDNRDNTNKCYPASDCDTKTTASVAAALKLGGYDTSYRIVHDAQLYLLTKQNVIPSGSAWQFNFSPEVNLSNSTSFMQCLVNNSVFSIYYNFSYVENTTGNTTTNFTKPTFVEYNFTAYEDRRIDLLCTENITATMLTHDRDTAISYTGGDNVTYTLPKPCWSDKVKWDSCTDETTMLAMMSGISSTYTDLALPFLDEQAKSNAVGNYFHASNMLLNAYYLYIKGALYSESNSTMLQWLFYNQNNDGSWGSGTATNRIEPSANVIMAFEREDDLNDTEFIEDAKDWVSANEPTSGWSTTVQAALAFNSLKGDIRAFLKSDPILVTVTGESTEVVIYNPSTFDLDDLTFTVSDHFEDVLLVSAFSELAADTSKKITLSQTGTKPSNNFGYITVTEGEDEIAKIPLSVFKHETIDITYTDSLTIFGKSTALKLQVSKSSGTFTCSIAWDSPDISSKTEVEVSSQTEISLGINMKTAERRQEEYTGTMTCVSGLNSKTIPLVLNVNQYPSQPFELTPKLLTINSSAQDISFTVENKLTEPLTVNLRFAQTEPYFQLESSSIVVNPRASKDVKIINLVPEKVNLSSSVKVMGESLGQTDSTTISVEIEVTSVNFILYSAILVLLLAAITAVGILYRERIMGMDAVQQLLSKIPGGVAFAPKPQVDNSMVEAERALKAKYDKEENKIKLTIIMNSIRILQNAGKDEDDIKKKLAKEGFGDDEVKDAFDQLDSINKEKADLEQKQANVAIIDMMNKNSAVIRTKLRQEGFSDKQIQAALAQLRTDYKEQETVLKDALKEKDVKVPEGDAEQKEEKKE